MKINRFCAIVETVGIILKRMLAGEYQSRLVWMGSVRDCVEISSMFSPSNMEYKMIWCMPKSLNLKSMVFFSSERLKIMLGGNIHSSDWNFIPKLSSQRRKKIISIGQMESSNTSHCCIN